MTSGGFDAVIFDMDGVLVDSEPLWRRAELEVFPSVGVPLTEAQCSETVGLRIDEVVAHWDARHRIDEDHAAVAARIVERVIALVDEEAAPMPGVEQALRSCEARGLSLGLASSSSLRLIEAVLSRFGLRQRFSAVHSAEDEPQGKPHPAVYLATARALGVTPARCLAVEDSANGVRSARRAGMTCVAVPESHPPPDDPFADAALVLRSLTELDDSAWGTLLDGRIGPG